MLTIHNLLLTLKNTNKNIKIISIIKNTKINRTLLQLIWKANYILGYSIITNNQYLKIWHIKTDTINIQILNQKKKYKNFLNKYKFDTIQNKQIYSFVVYSNKHGIKLTSLKTNNKLGGKILW